jgi:transposase-like protein
MAAVVAALEGGATKAAVCRTFGIKRSTLIDSLARIGWSAGAKPQESMSDAPTAIDRDPNRRAVRSTHGTA